jgi:hypothetical protein
MRNFSPASAMCEFEFHMYKNRSDARRAVVAF